MSPPIGATVALLSKTLEIAETLENPFRGIGDCEWRPLLGMASSSGTKGEWGAPPPPRSLSSRNMSRQQTRLIDLPGEDATTMDSETLVPSSLASIAPILRVANEIESDNPRVAYLCRFHAYEKAHRMDPTSSGRGVRQFKTYLLHRLEKEEEETKPQLARSDPKEITLYYQNFYKTYIKEGQEVRKPEEMAKIYQTATVLYDVLRTVVPPAKVDDETQTYAKEVERKKEQYEPYNILPLYAVGVKPAMPKERVKSVTDVLDWLSSVFWFPVRCIWNAITYLYMLFGRNRSQARHD